MAKNIRGFLKNLFEYYFLNFIVNINFFSDLKFDYYYCEYYSEILLEVGLKYETKIDGRGHEIFSKKSLAHEIFHGYEMFFEKFVKPSTPPTPHPTLLNT